MKEYTGMFEPSPEAMKKSLKATMDSISKELGPLLQPGEKNLYRLTDSNGKIYWCIANSPGEAQVKTLKAMADERLTAGRDPLPERVCLLVKIELMASPNGMAAKGVLIHGT